MKGEVTISNNAVPFGWISAWLFNWGFLNLTGWKIFFALFIWPYYLGVHFFVAG